MSVLYELYYSMFIVGLSLRKELIGQLSPLGRDVMSIGKQTIMTMWRL